MFSVEALWTRLKNDNTRLAGQRETIYMVDQNRTLQEILRERRAQMVEEMRGIEQAIAELQSRRSALAADIDRIDAAIRVIGETGDSDADLEPRLTIKQAVIKILERAPRGLAALQILERLRTEFQMDYPRTSLSPQLSRLKNEGKIGLKGNVWYLINETAQEPSS
jgi:hypothetical protein